YCQLRRVRWTSSGPWPPRSRRQKPTGRIYSAGVPVRDVASPPMPAPPPPPPPPPPRPPAPKRTGFAPKTPHGVLQVDWPFFGELCRALALKIFREYDPDVVIGIAKAGVIPGAVVASILQRDFASVAITRQETGARPVVMAGPPRIVAGRRVLIVDETCDSGDTMKLALNAVRELKPAAVKTAVSFRTGPYQPDFYALETDNFIILPWDREVIIDGEIDDDLAVP